MGVFRSPATSIIDFLMTLVLLLIYFTKKCVLEVTRTLDLPLSF